MNMKNNEYTRKEKVCPLIGDYCNEEHKNCDRCIAEEDARSEERRVGKEC